MKKHIAEELPARKYAAAPPASSGGGGKDDDGGREKEKATSPEKRVQQAVYDIRYRARREKITLQQAFSQYMQNSSVSGQERTLIKQKLFGKGGMQAEDFHIEDCASSHVADALFKVFVEGVKVEEPIRLLYLEKMETAANKKYLVRVEDKNGGSYTRRANIEKISQLRANPNIRRVEMLSTDPNKKTAYGDPYEGERDRGELTAKATAGKDYDGDGKIESGAKEHAGAVHNAIQRKKGGVPDGNDTSSVKEEFLSDAKSDAPIGSKGKRKKNKVIIGPDVPGSNKGTSGSSYSFRENAYDKFINNLHSLQEKAESEQQQKLFGLALSVKRGETPRSEASAEVLKIVDTMSEKKIRDFAKTSHKGLPVHKEECGCDDEEKGEKMKGMDDPRSIPTTISLIKARLRSKGIKDPMMMVSSYEPNGKIFSESEEERDELRRKRYDIEKDPRMGSLSPHDENLAKRKEKDAASRAAKEYLRRQR